MAQAAPLPLSVVNRTVARPSPDARFGLDSLVTCGPRDHRAQRAVAPSVLSFVAHVVIVAAIVVLPLVLDEISLPAASDAKNVLDSPQLVNYHIIARGAAPQPGVRAVRPPLSTESRTAPRRISAATRAGSPYVAC